MNRRIILDAAPRNQSPQRFEFPGPEVKVGRSPERADLTFPGVAGPSRVHGAIVIDEDGQPWVEDRRSSNGTRLNGRNVQRAPLVPGDEIHFSTILVTFVGLAPELEEDPRVTSLRNDLIRARRAPLDEGSVEVWRLSPDEQHAWRVTAESERDARIRELEDRLAALRAELGDAADRG